MSEHRPPCIRVNFSEYGNELPYAASLAHHLSTTLAITIPFTGRDVLRVASTLGQSPEEIKDYVSGMVELRGRPTNILSIFQTQVEAQLAGESENHRDDIVVTRKMGIDRNVRILFPAQELWVFRNTRGPIFVPLGDGPSSLAAVKESIVLAKKMKTSLLLWHTTWRNTLIASTDPKEHIASSARKIIAKAEELAIEEGVLCKSCVIECANTVVEGMIRMALLSGAALIVIARGKRKMFGAYADRVRARNCPVPVLILP